MNPNYIFTLLAFITILCALYVVISKNPIHSVIALILTFFSISAHYVLLNTQFLAIVNLIVYAGAIMVLFLFVLMFLNLNKETEPVKSTSWLTAAAIASGCLLVVLVATLREGSELVMKSPNGHAGLVKTLGKLLFSKYLVPFELSGILFLAAMVGAVFLGKKKGDDDQDELIIQDNAGGNNG
ncbi:MAG: NADH-quinone oxidoreductase subunit J [Bacteroidetes bacterium]|nr:NADH-quinone oxidoreductase subunit J [Bacteroidota bacterium]